MRTISYASLVASVVVVYVVYLATVALHRLLFHPLAKFPGPRLAAVTRLYEAYYDLALGGRYTHKIAELHEQYGPIIRISPYELHIHDSHYYDKFYRDDSRSNKYAWTYDAVGAKDVAISTADHEAHRRRRAPFTPFFSKPAVSSRVDFIQATVDKLGERIDGFVDSEEVLNLGAAYSALTSDIATEFTLGESNHNLDQDNFNEDMAVILQSMGTIWRWTKHFWFVGPLVRGMPMGVAEKIVDSKMRAFLSYLMVLTSQVCDLMTAHVSGQRFVSARPNLVDVILSSKHLLDSEKSVRRVADEISAVTSAGFETTALALRMTSYHLYTHPSVLARLRAELRQLTNTLPPGERPTWTQLSQLPYLTAVIMEGLRLSTGLVTRMARVSRDEIRYGAWKIPAGTPVGMTTILMHYDESIFHDAKKFDPQRFVDQEERWKLEKYFAPFSRGSRMCLGMHLAWAELYLTLAMVVSRFDFEFVDTGPEDVEFHTDQFVFGPKGTNGIKAIAKQWEWAS
ncbi:cytochrome P450 [Thozetella sp. PMI_491]|nr:cytochrome P450 [Thozetella sp. PMI_491]